MTDGSGFDALDDELRERTGDVIRRDAEEAAADADLLRRRGRDLTGLLTEAMHRGDRVRATVAGRWTVAGDLARVGADFATVVDGHTVVDMATRAIVVGFERAAYGGAGSDGGSRTLIARLRELEQTGEQVELRTDSGHELHGAVTIVASDHLMVTDLDGVEHAMPTRSVVMVVRPLRPR